MKKTGMLFLIIIALTHVVHADLTLDQPTGGEKLIIKTPYKIKWHAPAQEGYQPLTIYLEKADDASWVKVIDNTHIKSDGEHLWQVGKLSDDTFVAPGEYKIFLENEDGNAVGEPFTIEAAAPVPEIVDYLKQIRQIKIMYNPGACPICFRLNLKDAKALLPKIKESYWFHLYKGEKIISKLGGHGGGNMLDNYIPIRLNPRNANVLKINGGDTYTIHLLNERGNTIAISEVFLELVKFQIETRKIPKLKPPE